MSASAADLLSQSHSQATLAEHLEYALLLERHKGPLTGEVLKFFGVRDFELAMKQMRFADYELPNIHRALARHFRHWRLEFAGGETWSLSKGLWAPIYRRVEVRPGKFGNYLLAGSLFYRLAGGSKRVLLFEEDYDPPIVECTLIGLREEAGEMRREAAALARWMKRHHYLRRQAVRADATLLRKRQRVSWDEVALEPAVRAAIEENTLGILRRRALFKRNGIPQKRGLLLHGPPGTGKTMVGKALADSGCATFVWATAADVTCTKSLRRLFQLARKLKPAIVFLEDLDLYAGERGGASDTTLGELLSQMDGLEGNDGVIVVATTNDLAAIEPALAERPSRFDVVLEIGLPEAPARRAILARELRLQVSDDMLLDDATRETAGISGAQVREVAFLAIQRAILRGALADGIARPAAGDIRAAVEQVTGRRKRAAIGFHATR